MLDSNSLSLIKLCCPDCPEEFRGELRRDLIEVKLMWIPSHVGLVGNKLVDGETRYASSNGSIFDRPALSLCDFQSLARPVLLREWQMKWDLAYTGRFAHSILPRVSLRP
jgi:hypothetical protein